MRRVESLNSNRWVSLIKSSRKEDS